MPQLSQTDELLEEILGRLVAIEKKVESLLGRSDETTAHKSHDDVQRSLHARAMQRLERTMLDTVWLVHHEPGAPQHHKNPDSTHGVHDYLAHTKPALKDRLQSICEPIRKEKYGSSFLDRELLEQYSACLVMLASEAAPGSWENLRTLLAKERSSSSGEKE